MHILHPSPFCTPPCSFLLLGFHFCTPFTGVGVEILKPPWVGCRVCAGQVSLFWFATERHFPCISFFLCPHQTAQIRLLGRIFSLFQSRFDEGKFENLSCHWLRERGAALGGVGGRKPRIAVGGLLCRTPHRFTQVTTFSGFTFFLTENMCLFDPIC